MEIDRRYINTECESLKNLSEITKFFQDTNIEFVIIGGYAVSVYCPKKRFTKDIDIATTIEYINPLISQLRRAEFEVDPFRHGERILKASKSNTPQNIELHVSVGEVFDNTTSNSYPSDRLMADKNYLEINPFYIECEKYKIKIPVVNPNDAFILKAMTNRDRDIIDCFLYLNSNHLDLNQIALKLSQFSQIKTYILNRFTGILSDLRRSIAFLNSLLIQQGIITDYSFSNQDIRNLTRAVKELIKKLRE